jgi:hypothetical protein
MPATLRQPDLLEIDPQDGSTRGERLRVFVTQRLAPLRERVSLIAWHEEHSLWAAWFDQPTTGPAAKPDPLAEAQVTIGT